MSHVVVFADQYVVGWDGTAAGADAAKDGCVYGLKEAILARQTRGKCAQPSLVWFAGDPVSSGDEHPRLLKAAPARLKAMGSDIMFESIWFDIDYRFKQTRPPPSGWHAAQVEKLPNLPKGLGWYTTTNGLRLLWPLLPALKVDEFEALHNSLFREISRHIDDGDTLVDPECRSWVHCYFLPNEDARIDLDSMHALEWTPSAAAEYADIDFYLSALSTQSFVLPDKIPGGARNKTIFRYVCQLLAKGIPEPLALEYAATAARERCTPPMGLGEVESIVRKAYKRYQITKNDGPVSWVDQAEKHLPSKAENGVLSSVPEWLEAASPVTLARSLLNAMEAQTPESVVFDRDQLHYYEPQKGCWIGLDKEEVFKLIYKLDRVPVAAGEDKNGQPKIVRLSMSHNIAKDVYTIMSNERAKPGFFDDPATGCAFANGFVHVVERRVELTDNGPHHRVRFAFPFCYVPEAKPELYEKFLNDLFVDDIDRADKVALVREFLGVALLGYSTKLAKVLFLLGEGSNGKSEFFSIIEAIFDATGRRSKMVCNLPLHKFSETFALAKLKDAYLNLVDDMSAKVVAESATFKSAVTGENVSAAFKFGNEFDFSPCAAHAFNLNRLPAVLDPSHGLWRRMMVVSFNRQFVLGVDAEPDIGKKVASAELEQIVSWLIAGGANAVARRSYTTPHSTRVLIERWRSDSDSVRDFLTDELMEEYPDEDAADGWKLAVAQIYMKYTMYVQANMGKPVGRNQFLTRLATWGCERGRESSGRFVKLPPKEMLLSVVSGGK